MPRQIPRSVPSPHSQRAGSPGGYPRLVGRTVAQRFGSDISIDPDELEQKMLCVDIVRSAPL